jgi:Fur family ferric uptake transcriptional regulator
MSLRITSCPSEEQMLRRYCADNGLHISGKRLDILRVFHSTERHLSAEELFRLMYDSGVPVAYATVYRALRLFVSCGLARKVALGGRGSRFEHAVGHEHHDHLVCTRCGRTAEFYHRQLEELQTEVARGKGFMARSHSLTIYGLCATCAGKEGAVAQKTRQTGG